jgi:hypothetical protein
LDNLSNPDETEKADRRFMVQKCRMSPSDMLTPKAFSIEIYQKLW